MSSPFEEEFNRNASKVDGNKKKAATLTEVTKWMKANDIFGKNFTSNHLDISWAKFATAKDGKVLNFEVFSTKVLELCYEKYKMDKKCSDLAEAKQMLIDNLSKRVELKSGPVANKAITDKLTDTSKYTGAHKERFDADGKGKGADGREDRAENTGYVGNYKGQNTYDEK